MVAAHKRGGRRKFPKSLPHVTIVHDIPEADKQCGDCHDQTVVCGGNDGKAMTYACNEWSRLIVYLEGGRIEIDNNGGERSIKPFVIGRKNWLFCNTASDATASAVIYSLLQSAKANELPLIAWLTFVLEELPRCTKDDERRSLLPHRFDIKRLNGKI